MEWRYYNMENNLMYTFEGNDVRIVMKDNEPWFVAKDVCSILELSDVSMSLKRLDEDDKLIQTVFVSGQNRNVSTINESGLYDLIFTSRKEEAKKFKRWVTSDVLPTIRKHGIYATENIVEQVLDNPDMMIDLLMKLKEERAARKEAETTVAVLTHVNKTYTATEIAKELGFKSAIAMNKELHSLGVQYQQNGTWVLYSKYADLGYDQIKQEVLDNGRVVYHRRFTQRGREFLIKLLSR
ncbi:antirepressor protein [Lysinibacillus phage vB_LspM-01]|nr:antirepressor protein [Lysinibacillus phage vB_LspM-01]